MPVEKEHVDSFPVPEMVGLVGKIGTAPEVVVCRADAVGTTFRGSI